MQTVWGNCAGLIARPVCTVALSDHSGVEGVTAAEATLVSANFALETPSRTDDSQQYGSRSATPSQPVLPGDPLDDSPLPNCPIRDVVFTERDMHLLAELRRASAMALPRCVVSRYATALAERSHGRSPVLGFTLPLPLSLAPC